MNSQANLSGENKMGVMPVAPLIITMSFPIMVSMLIQALYNIVDSVFVARFSNLALTAVSLAFPLQNLMVSVAVGTSIGMNSLLSRRLGAGNTRDVEKAAGNGMSLAFLSWVVFAIVGVTCSRAFFSLFSDDPALVEAGSEYSAIVLFFSLGLFLNIMGERVLQGTGDTIHSMIAQMAGAVTNIILDPLMIFGLLGFPSLGIRGAAIATVIGQHVSFLLAFLFIRKNRFVRLRKKDLKLERRTVRGIYAVGLPSIVMQSIGTLMTSGFNKILIAFGTDAVSVFGIYFKLQSFIFMPVFGLNSGLVPVIGYNYGAGNRKRMTEAVKTGAVVAISVMAVGTAIFCLFPKALLSWFNANEEMVRIGLRALPILSACFIPAGLSIALTSLFQGIGDGIYSMSVSVTRQIVVLLPVAWLLSKIGGLNDLWYSFLIAEAASLLLTVVLYIHEYNRKVRER